MGGEPATDRDLPAVPRPSHRWWTPEGMRLVGDVWGPAGGRPAILLHGGGQTRHAWRGAGQALAALGYRAVAYDARGHGGSSWSTEGDYDDAAHVRDLVAVVADLGSTRSPVLVGASMGGLTSLAAVATGQVTPAALVLVDVVPRVDPVGLARIREFMTSSQDGFDTLEDVADALAAYQPQRDRPARLAGLAKVVRRDGDGRYRWHWDPRLPLERDPEVLLARYESYARTVLAPTLVVRGGRSDVVLADGLRHFRRAVPHAEVAEVDGAAHMVAGDDNDAFVAVVTDFLARVISP